MSTDAKSSPATQTRRPFGIYLGRFLDIQFFLDYSWFLIAALVVWGLSSHLFPTWIPGLTDATYLLMGGVAAVLFFLSILLHELGHSVVSQRCGIPVPRITLLFIGGIAEISREPDTAKAELKIALGGPAVTLILVVLYETLALALKAADLVAPAVVFEWLAIVNLILLIFNAFPGYPLDGGRVLRALIWARTGNFRHATFITSRIGVGFSWMLMGLGVFLLWFHQSLNGFIFLLIGLFLKAAADSGYRQALYTEVLAGIKVREIMTPNPVCIPAHTPLNFAVDDFFLANHHIAFPVCDDDGTLRGILRLEHLKSIEREKWPYMSAGDAAASGAETCSVEADTPAQEVMQRLLQPGQGRIAVTEDGRVTGIITRADILAFIRIHSELEG